MPSRNEHTLKRGNYPQEELSLGWVRVLCESGVFFLARRPSMSPSSGSSCSAQHRCRAASSFTFWACPPKEATRLQLAVSISVCMVSSPISGFCASSPCQVLDILYKSWCPFPFEVLEVCLWANSFRKHTARKPCPRLTSICLRIFIVFFSPMLARKESLIPGIFFHGTWRKGGRAHFSREPAPNVESRKRLEHGSCKGSLAKMVT